jgi:hypothetical protein
MGPTTSLGVSLTPPPLPLPNQNQRTTRLLQALRHSTPATAPPELMAQNNPLFDAHLPLGLTLLKNQGITLPTFNQRGAIDTNVSSKLNTMRLQHGATGSCVATVQRNLWAAKLPGFRPTGGPGNNNSLNAIHQLVASDKWASVKGNLPEQVVTINGKKVTLSPMTQAHFEQLVAKGTLPVGAIVYQTRHFKPGQPLKHNGISAFGNDLAILRRPTNGKPPYLHNFRPVTYGNGLDVYRKGGVVLVAVPVQPNQGVGDVITLE